MSSASPGMRDFLESVYGDQASDLERRIQARVAAFRARNPQLHTAPVPPDQRLSARDVMLITYGDQIQDGVRPPLQVLDETLRELVGDTINSVHILPFFPYTSDDGFSVVDYQAIDPALGDWQDVRTMADHFRLMFDAVINHISQASSWFQAFKRGEAPYTDYFIAVDPATDLSAVVRPRTLPLLTPVETAHGLQHVWTTFSADQIDLNYACPDLLLEVLDALLLYVEQGAQRIRLDAIGFMWKEIGTNCLHLPQTHALIKLMRVVLDETAPATLLVTETNVPHAENVSYFGNGQDEAQMVYNFTLPPLTLHAFMTGDASHLSRWAATLTTPSDQTTFFNFMASHDGIGLRPLEGILPVDEVERMAQQVLAHGGRVSYKTNRDGSQSPYELNVVYFDALNNPASEEAEQTQIDRFMASQAILLSLRGVPGIYVHSLFGSRNWIEGVAETGHNRTINRRKFQRAALMADLAAPASIPHAVFARFRQLIRARTADAAFHPNGGQRVLELDPRLFALERTSPNRRRTVRCLHNVSSQAVTVTVEMGVVHADVVDVAGSGPYRTDGQGSLTMTVPPFGVRWLRPAADAQPGAAPASAIGAL